MKILYTITGTYSVGKTTLTNHIKTKFQDDYFFIPEHAQEYLEYHNININNLSVRERLGFQQTVINSKLEDYKRASRDSIEDTSFISTLSYINSLNGEDLDVLLDRHFKMYEDNFDKIVFIHIEPVIKLDEQSFRINDDSYRMEINNIQKRLLRKVLDRPKVEGVITILEDSFDERKKIIDNILIKT